MSVSAQIYTDFPSIADARIVESIPSTNFGTSTTIEIHDTPTPNKQRAFVQFDTTSYEMNTTVESCNLQLTATAGSLTTVRTHRVNIRTGVVVLPVLGAN